jgi:hypothetical protein
MSNYTLYKDSYRWKLVDVAGEEYIFSKGYINQMYTNIITVITSGKDVGTFLTITHCNNEWNRLIIEHIIFLMKNKLPLHYVQD